MPTPLPRAALRGRLTVDRTHLLKKIINLEAGSGVHLLCASTLQCQSWCPACIGHNQYFVCSSSSSSRGASIQLCPIPCHQGYRELPGRCLSFLPWLLSLKDKATKNKRAAILLEPSPTQEALQTWVIAYPGQGRLRGELRPPVRGCSSPGARWSLSPDCPGQPSHGLLTPMWA